MSIYTEISKAWATLFGFKVESNQATFNEKPLYWNNNAVEDWDDLLSAKPSDLKQSAGVAEVPNTKTYDELMTPENFSYSAFNWENEHGTRVGYSLGSYHLTLSSEPINNIFFYSSYYGVGVHTEDYWGENYGLGYYGYETEYYIATTIDGKRSYEIYQDEYYMPTEYFYTCFYLVSINPSYPEVYVYISDGRNDVSSNFRFYQHIRDSWVLQPNPISIDDSDTWLVYFDDGAHLPEGLEWDEELASYFVPEVKAETTAILTQTTATQAMLGAQIMTHVSLWGMGIGCACIIVALVKFMARCFSRR